MFLLAHDCAHSRSIPVHMTWPPILNVVFVNWSRICSASVAVKYSRRFRKESFDSGELIRSSSGHFSDATKARIEVLKRNNGQNAQGVKLNRSLLETILREPLEMLDFSNSVVSDEHEISKLEVLRHNLITQRVSPRRDVVY